MHSKRSAKGRRGAVEGTTFVSCGPKSRQHTWFGGGQGFGHPFLHLRKKCGFVSSFCHCRKEQMFFVEAVLICGSVKHLRRVFALWRAVPLGTHRLFWFRPHLSLRFCFCFRGFQLGCLFELDSDWGQVDEVLIASGLS